jgi:hypothetical protein
VGFGLAWLGPLPSVFVLGVLFLPAMDSLHLFSKQKKNIEKMLTWVPMNIAFLKLQNYFY